MSQYNGLYTFYETLKELIKGLSINDPNLHEAYKLTKKTKMLLKSIRHCIERRAQYVGGRAEF